MMDNAIPIKGGTKRPYQTVMHPSDCLSCFMWAAQYKDIQERFKNDTGYDLHSLVRANGLARIIDEATGYQAAIVAAFWDWFVMNIWGEEGAEIPKEEKKEAQS
jgi:hypothetical protein